MLPVLNYSVAGIFMLLLVLENNNNSSVSVAIIISFLWVLTGKCSSNLIWQPLSRFWYFWGGSTQVGKHCPPECGATLDWQLLWLKHVIWGLFFLYQWWWVDGVHH